MDRGPIVASLAFFSPASIAASVLVLSVPSPAQLPSLSSPPDCPSASNPLFVALHRLAAVSTPSFPSRVSDSVSAPLAVLALTRPRLVIAAACRSPLPLLKLRQRQRRALDEQSGLGRVGRVRAFLMRP